MGDELKCVVPPPRVHRLKRWVVGAARRDPRRSLVPPPIRWLTDPISGPVQTSEGGGCLGESRSTGGCLTQLRVGTSGSAGTARPEVDERTRSNGGCRGIGLEDADARAAEASAARPAGTART